MLIIGWLVAIGLLALLFHKKLYAPRTPEFNQLSNGVKITLYREHDSHFRISGLLNGHPVTFLIDTGATTIAIPASIAQAAGLPLEQEVVTHTANGNAVGYATRIDHLTVGPVPFSNIRAIIIPNMSSDELLLGMSILKKFVMKQTREKLILTLPTR